ncbi:MAG: GNAT family N-acetyltransferase [bacterium]|nr:GNAT family N-acetyltransferase [bacterium]
MHDPVIRLEEMTGAAFDDYMDVVTPTYADAVSKARGIARNEALASARRQLDTLLPDGRDTAGQHFKTLRSASGDRLGILWYATRFDAPPAHLFIYDIVIDKANRGQGLGTAVLQWLDEEARRVGAKEIQLHVFASNSGAIRLYERMGFVTTLEEGGGRRMVLAL